MEHKNWNGFIKGVWQDEINVRDFIQQNYKEYKGDASFLAGATQRTEARGAFAHNTKQYVFFIHCCHHPNIIP